MSNEFSVEALVAMGTGLVSNKTNKVTASIEGYDGYDDEIYAAVTRSEESLKFLDTYELMENKKTSDKLKMLKKINNIYGIENYTKSLEDNNDTNTEKKKGIFKTIWEGIKKFFKALWNYVKKFFTWVKNSIATLFRSKKPEDKVNSILDTSSPEEVIQIVEDVKKSGLMTEPQVELTEKEFKTYTNQFENEYQLWYKRLEETAKPSHEEKLKQENKRKLIIYNKLIRFFKNCEPVLKKIDSLAYDHNKKTSGVFPIIGEPIHVIGKMYKPEYNNNLYLIHTLETLKPIIKDAISNKNFGEKIKYWSEDFKKAFNTQTENYWAMINCGLNFKFIYTDFLTNPIDVKINKKDNINNTSLEKLEDSINKIFLLFGTTEQVKNMIRYISEESKQLDNLMKEYDDAFKELDKLSNKLNHTEEKEIKKGSLDQNDAQKWFRELVLCNIRNGLTYVEFLTKYYSLISQLYGVVYKYLC